jgi:hypothetical protein
MGMNIQAMMKQAQAMQKDLKEKKGKISSMEFEGVSSIVKVKVNGNKDVLSVEIMNKQSFEKDDLEMLEDMFVVAINDAFKKVDQEMSKEFGKYGNMGDFF